MQPLLLPGTRVLRRDARHLQVGLDPATRVVLPDTPDLRRLETGERLRHDPALAVRLAPVLLPDDAPLRAALPPAGHASYDDPGAWSRHALAALGRRGTGTEALAQRGSCAVVVQAAPPRRRDAGTDHLPGALAEDLRLLCRRSGLRAEARLPGGPSLRRPAVLRVLVAVGEPDRSIVDAWREPHLVVRFVEGHAVVGPLVLPGETACLRCVDAHLSDGDPAWPLLLEQYARHGGGTDRADGIPEPLDPALAAVSLGLAVRQLATYAEGGDPDTVGASLRLAPDLAVTELQEWPRHPDCGCDAT